MIIDMDSEYFRGVITGKIRYRKCPLCDNNGVEIQAYDDMGEPCQSDHPEAQRHPCEACDEVGFIEIPEEY